MYICILNIKWEIYLLYVYRSFPYQICDVNIISEIANISNIAIEYYVCRILQSIINDIQSVTTNIHTMCIFTFIFTLTNANKYIK